VVKGASPRLSFSGARLGNVPKKPGLIAPPVRNIGPASPWSVPLPFHGPGAEFGEGHQRGAMVVAELFEVVDERANAPLTSSSRRG